MERPLHPQAGHFSQPQLEAFQLSELAQIEVKK
jgi:hypothetical protein